jgi:outer membrane protein assembly factor BamB
MGLPQRRHASAPEIGKDPGDRRPLRVWRARVEAGRSVPTPAVAGDSVIVGGGFGSHAVYAFDARTGRPRWTRPTSDDGPTSLVIQAGFAAFNTESCTLEVIRVATGESVWRRWLGDPLLAQPAASEQAVFAVYPQRGRHLLAAFGLRDGAPRWSLALAHDAISAPVLADGHVYLSTYDGSVHCVDAASGRLAWSEQRRATSAPWIHGGEVFVSQREEAPAGERGSEAEPLERTSRYDSARGAHRHSYESKRAEYLHAARARSREAFYQAHDASVGFGAAPSSAKLEHVEKLFGHRSVSRTWRHQGSRPVVVDGVLYDSTGDALEARDLELGAVLWRWEARSADEGERALTPPAVANGRVWIGTWDGRLVCLNAATGLVRWQVRAGGPVHWQPVASGGRVFAGLECGELVCVETGDPCDDGWPMWGGGPGHNG